ncbi:MAG TPA: metallophosphoesterase [Bacteroidales bacterium]|nr:metallophosphoesterase [Bacteroidales bacterium]
MRLIQFIIFFGLVLTLHLLVNYYIFIRGLRTFEQGSLLRQLYTLGFWTLAASFFVGRALERVYLSHLSDLFTWAGSFWLAAMLYLFLAVFVIDLLRLLNLAVPVLAWTKNTFIQTHPHYLTIGIALGVFLLVLGGHINAIFPRVNRVSIAHNTRPDADTLRIVLATDIHLGTIVGPNRVRRMVNRINAQQPDLVLLAGDIVDEDLAPVIRQNLGQILGSIDAPLGVIGSTGNHEYIGGADEATAYLTQHNIIMLRDTAMAINDKLWVIGRNDIESNRFVGELRKPLSEIVQQIPEGAFTIVLDHQPRAYNEAMQNGVNLILSGHTHHGQLWPLNYITSAMFPLSWGYKQFGDMHAYVSSGVGSWGPPVRIGNVPEIVVIELKY